MLRDRNAALFLAAVVTSGFGSSALWLASGIWVKALTGSNGLAGLCVFALWLATLVGPWLGTFADRTRRRPLLVRLDLALAALLPVLLAVDSRGDLWLLYTVLVAYGAVGVVHDAAQSAIVGMAIDPALLGDLNGLRMAANEGMKLVAPLAGAGLYAAYGGASVALLDAVTFALSAALYACLRVRELPPEPPLTSWRAQTVAGIARIRSHARVRPLVLAGGATMFFAGLNGASIYAVVAGLGHPPSFTGVLYAVQGTGSVVIGTASGPLIRRLGERRFATYGIALTAAAVALRAIPDDTVALACSAASGLGLPCVLIAALTAVQRETPSAVLGSTAATANTAMFAPNAVALAVGAGLVEVVDYRVLVVAFGAGMMAVAATLKGRPGRGAGNGASDREEPAPANRPESPPA
ncbi:major facilitator superfamily MFS_1 [Actinobacteria bacterium OK074]|nr:major facilitator superfamily MFS_1 [Actinobacteria bacterium OK074]